MIQCTGAWEHRFSLEQLSNQTAKTPDVHTLRVLTPSQKKLRCPIPPGSYIFGHDQLLLLVLVTSRPHESEVTDLDIAILVYQNVGWFEIPMDKLRTVYILQCLGYLVDHILFMFFFENVLSDDSMQVYLHEVKNYVDILLVVRLEDVAHFDYVSVLELPQVKYFSVGPLGISGMLEGIEYFL